ncbi:class I SAM-dependent methyltransferase [Prochlorococcus marinus XMU1410]|uniref:class I SAM-dependent methyltransferase n=1 Tax=Prochlorococcus marinus TaxID=1219 RepID=UPI001ADCA2AB|nr:class I SAM-dependent methyltransferase [Prochlorococcus marinus]MBO8242406.1 class I SAM-dependent methyltransferase [Prochlorococcus marinus XMU1410]MBW3053553.1 hypothetical protein [Prochlorococcus marinus str. MU1410]
MSSNNFSDFYISSEYTKRNPTYHEEDSPHKWRNFKSCLKISNKNKKIKLSSIKSVCEIGCGTGGILNQLQNSNLIKCIQRIEGWDINPGAIDLAKQKYPRIKFINEDLFKTDNNYDLMICADVFEHIENSYSFLRNLNKKSKYFLFNIPLELSLSTMIRGNNIIRKAYNTVGHIHFYSASTANLMLELTGYEIIYQRFAKNRTTNFLAAPTFKKFVAMIPQFIIESINPYLSSVLMGDHLVVLAKRK